MALSYIEKLIREEGRKRERKNLVMTKKAGNMAVVAHYFNNVSLFIHRF